MKGYRCYLCDVELKEPKYEIEIRVGGDGELSVTYKLCRQCLKRIMGLFGDTRLQEIVDGRAYPSRRAS